MIGHIEASWKQALTAEFHKPYWHQLTERVTNAYRTTTVYPPREALFTAFSLCPLPTVRVVILGQDPYHGPGQAHGLAFSVESGAIPPSLRNIYKEITRDVRTPAPHTGNLTPWAIQGVLLLNTTLTVAAGAPGSHQGWGWEEFTTAVIETVSREQEHCVFLLWGAFAQSKRSSIDETKHLVLVAPHPSPLSAHRGFSQCGHFSQTNRYLSTHGTPPITW